MSVTAIITDKMPGADEPQFRFGNNNESVGKETIVRVWPKEGKPWFGFFPQGNKSDVDATGLHIWPSSNKMFVISKGCGYLVDAINPNNWSEADLTPITSYSSASTDGLLVISDNLRVAAYSAHRVLWKSSQISWNGIRNLEVVEGGVKGEAWDDMWGSWVSFLIDPKTGKHQGGATFTFDQT
jgi:hypothetical protein